MNAKSTIITALTCMLFAGCGGGSDWKGRATGQYDLQDGSGSSIEKRSETVKLEEGMDKHLRLGIDTPLADCDLKFAPVGPAAGTTGIEYKLQNADGIRCRSTLGRGGAPVDIYLQGGSSVTVTNSGEVTAVIYYGSQSPPEKRTLMFKGQKGWF